MKLRAAILLAVMGLARTAAAQDRFEIQVYDVETAAPRALGLELHLNYATQGTTTASAGEVATDRLAHFTLEPHVGVVRWLELGGYLQFALRPDGSFDFGGVKLRGKFRWPNRIAGGLIGLAANVEVSWIPSAYEPNVYGSELRPVIDLRWRRLFASVNPILDMDLGGALAGRPQFQPAAKVALELVPDCEIGVEYYGALGPLDAPLPASQQSHRVFGVVDLKMGSVDLNLGVGYGVLESERWTMKAILGHDL